MPWQVQVLFCEYEVFGPESSLVADRETGVTYLIIRNTFCSGITPLLNPDGKPVIWKADEPQKPTENGSEE